MYNHTFFTVRIGLFPGTLDPDVLEKILAEQYVRGWKVIRTFQEQKRLWLFFASED